MRTKRANGSLYREVQFALPQELNRREQVDLARQFAKSLTTNGEKLPYTLAVHRGDDGEPSRASGSLRAGERRAGEDGGDLVQAPQPPVSGGRVGRERAGRPCPASG